MKYNPPYGITDPDGPYINGDPSIGRAGSIPPAESIEYPQREIVNLITDAGLATPGNTDLRQLGKAVQSQLLISRDDGGTSNQYQVTMHPVPTAYFKYMTVIMKVGNANTGASTLNCNALGPKPISHLDGTALSSGELKAGAIACFVYDGTKFLIAWTTGGVASTGGEGTSPGDPIYLTAPTDFYVNNAIGSDTLYDGTTASVVGGTSHGPYKTIQKACDQVPKYNVNGWSITIHVADGAYANFYMRQMAGSGFVTLIGNTSNPASCTVAGASASAANYGQLTGIYKMRGFQLSATGPVISSSDPVACLNVSGNGILLYVGEMNWGASLAGAIVAQFGAIISNEPANCPWRIIGGASGAGGPFAGSFMYSSGQAQIAYNSGGGPAINVINAVTYAGAFAISITFGLIAFLYSSLAGAGNVTGTRYNVSNLSLISTAGGGASYFPGTVAGVANTAIGGYYT